LTFSFFAKLVDSGVGTAAVVVGFEKASASFEIADTEPAPARPDIIVSLEKEKGCAGREDVTTGTSEAGGGASAVFFSAVDSNFSDAGEVSACSSAAAGVISEVSCDDAGSGAGVSAAAANPAAEILAGIAGIADKFDVS
jgi:hypothetical protein